LSFSSDVKKELCSVELPPCCALAEGYGLMLFGRAFSGREISLLTENADVAKIYACAAEAVTGVSPILKKTKAGKYIIKVENPECRQKILTKFGYTGKETGLRINRAIFSGECCFGSFIRGAFLVCGIITSPEKEYHLAFSVSRRLLYNDFLKLFDEFDDISPKEARRNGAYLAYFKDSGSIEDMLTLMGATNSSLELMSVKMMKNIRNRVNRRTNFDNANIDRSVNAALAQLDAIRYIKKHRGFDFLPPELRELAVLRLENPECSLREICEKLEKPISRSGVNHRFKKIVEIYKEMHN